MESTGFNEPEEVTPTPRNTRVSMYVVKIRDPAESRGVGWTQGYKK